MKTLALITALFFQVQQEIYESDILYPEIVFRQAILETGWFECENCSMDHNNLFGFCYKKKYLEFDDWKESVAYYSRWQKRHFKGNTDNPEEYYQFLEDIGFATNPKYVERLKGVRL